MKKRITAIMLVLVLLFALSGCNKYEIKKMPEGKIGLITASREQFPEEYDTAAALKEKYPDNVVHADCKTNWELVAGDPDIFNKAVELAKNKDIEAIIFAKAVKGTLGAIEKIKEINNKVLIICVSPEESIVSIAAKADIVIDYDEIKAAEDMVKTTKQLGAEAFNYYSIKRHLKNPLYELQKNAIETACESEKVKFVETGAIDVNYSTGLSGARKFIRENVARVAKTYNSNVAFFSTDSSVQSVLIESVIEQKAIFVRSVSPSPGYGYREALALNLDEKKKEDTNYLLEQIKKGIESKGNSGRMATASLDISSILLDTALRFAVENLLGNENPKMEELAKSASKGETFTVNELKYKDKSYSNVFLLYNESQIIVF